MATLSVAVMAGLVFGGIALFGGDGEGADGRPARVPVEDDSSFSAGEFTIANEDPFDWTNVRLTVTQLSKGDQEPVASYGLEIPLIAAGETVTITAEDLGAISLMIPIDLLGECDTPRGPGFFGGRWDGEVRPGPVQDRLDCGGGYNVNSGSGSVVNNDQFEWSNVVITILTLEGDRLQVIDVPKLAPGESASFQQEIPYQFRVVAETPNGPAECDGHTDSDE